MVTYPGQAILVREIPFFRTTMVPKDQITFQVQNIGGEGFLPAGRTMSTSDPIRPAAKYNYRTSYRQ